MSLWNVFCIYSDDLSTLRSEVKFATSHISDFVCFRLMSAQHSVFGHIARFCCVVAAIVFHFCVSLFLMPDSLQILC